MGARNETGQTTRIVPDAADRSSREFNSDDITTKMILANKTPVVVGSLSITAGPGSGAALPVYAGTNDIGRSDTNRVVVNFGDGMISRSSHAVITFDPGTREAAVIDGGKRNPVYLNDEILTGRRPLRTNDTIRIGNTVFLFTLL